MKVTVGAHSNVNNSTWKLFEKLSFLIENAFKKDKNATIFHNYKILDNNKNERQFDIFIKSMVNDYEVNIAIECKYYSRKVSIDKIDAFANKCKHIPSINKKIFISKNGFQKGSVNQAISDGIDLYTLENLTENLIDEWNDNPKLYRYEISSKLLYTNSYLVKDLTKKNDTNFKFDWDCKVYRKTKLVSNIQKIFEDIFTKNKKHYEETIFKKLDFISKEVYFPQTISQPIIITQKYFLKDKSENTINVKRIIIMIEITINRNDYTLKHSHSYKELKSNFPKCNIHCVSSESDDIKFLVENSDRSIFELFREDNKGNLLNLDTKYIGVVN